MKLLARAGNSPGRRKIWGEGPRPIAAPGRRLPAGGALPGRLGRLQLERHALDVEPGAGEGEDAEEDGAEVGRPPGLDGVGGQGRADRPYHPARLVQERDLELHLAGDLGRLVLELAEELDASLLVTVPLPAVD